ncbi:beta-glucoside operon transcriptional antiterminator [Brachybacterium muris]|uniref:PRD domain-containing protein n=1 Tax=Brachybacterium muris TaxID=219301 RepID=UPI001956A331|nr:PRD domain-containing protein [Brachybacterium muris]MBM7501683.1 beta-glucoside operon transcriptional antiterminator [Brachybacterium muris]MCT2294721.1 PRD domain-containing protein [Brachybacterium muris]
MKILRVLNNNVVLSRDASGREVILTGRGLGFQKQPGQEVDPRAVVRTFVPTDGRDPDNLATVLAALDQDVVRAVVLAISETQLEPAESTQPTLAIAVADHMAQALKRERDGTRIDYPLRAEVQTLYREEYDKAARLLAAINHHIDPPLPPTEATALALHLVNAGFSSGDLSFTYTMTGVIQQMLTVISERYGIPAERDSISGARFITHVRYLFVRVHQHRQLTRQDSVIGESIRTAYPEATRTARQLATIVEVRLGTALTEDEVSYLALHVARMTLDAETDEVR